ncbi:hypothetical protein [Streptomyces luteolus]|uniref:hypothetical protein n=1 Tax=Streptomyces luteolus TaxID=3043615 RepID=UPI0038D0ED94
MLNMLVPPLNTTVSSWSGRSGRTEHLESAAPAILDVEEAQREATAAAIEAASDWRPRSTWRFFAVTLNAANCIEWHEDEMTLRHWDHVNGLQPTERRRLDIEARLRPSRRVTCGHSAPDTNGLPGGRNSVVTRYVVPELTGTAAASAFVLRVLPASGDAVSET